MIAAPFDTTGDTPSRRRGSLVVTVTLVALCLLTALFHALDLDLRIEALFYHPDDGWRWRHAQPWEALYRWGTIPGLLLTVGSLVALSISLATRRWARHQRNMLLISLTAILGAGLLINAVLKPYWGRPRPRQVQAFSGEWTYRAPHERGTPGQGESFPCGHCTMGYLFVTLFFLRRQAPRLAYWGGGFGLLYGSLVGLARMVQGAHFPTDVLWALGLIWLTAAGLHYFLLPGSVRWLTTLRQLNVAQRRNLAALVLVAVAIVTALFLTRRPYFKTFAFDLPLSSAIHSVALSADLPLSRQITTYDDRRRGKLRVHASGFGWVTARCRVRLTPKRQDGRLDLFLESEPEGYFSELSFEVEWILPSTTQGRLHIVGGSTDTGGIGAGGAVH
ncbi:MAG: phosphatase PAP2 family protein [Desulfosarcinaceae bacterium]|nr:phosphatase PAP2 family protein [Desulfosarcinaceae bacterium]